MFTVDYKTYENKEGNLMGETTKKATATSKTINLEKRQKP
jgi:hypothetical protein